MLQWMQEHWIQDELMNLSTVMEDHIAKKGSLSTMCLHVLAQVEDEHPLSNEDMIAKIPF